MRDVGSNPADTEAASLPDTIRTIRAHHELGAPEPPVDSLAREYMTGSANETDESPERARTLTRWMLAKTYVLRMHARRMAVTSWRCGHPRSPENTARDSKGERCRACKRMKSRRKAA